MFPLYKFYKVTAGSEWVRKRMNLIRILESTKYEHHTNNSRQGQLFLWLENSKMEISFNRKSLTNFFFFFF